MYARFLEWIEKGETKTKSKVAGKLLFDLLEKRVIKHLTTEGLQRIRIIMDSLRRFEGFIEQFRTGFAGKIYRDHLNHMIRTTILASYLGKLLDLRSRDIRRLEAAALFHDAAYPVQEAASIFTRVKDDLEGAYSTVNFAGLYSNIDIPLTIDQLQERVEIPLKLLLDKDKPNHAVIGALEFVSQCVDKSNGVIVKKSAIPIVSSEVLDISTAICLHDSDFEQDIKFIENPIAGFLIIADELQDWGRPTSQPNGDKPIPLSKITGFRERTCGIRLVIKDDISSFTKKEKQELKEIASKWEELIKPWIRECWNEPEKWSGFNDFRNDLRESHPNVDLSKANIEGEMCYEGEKFPLVEVVYSKFRNLSRINFETFPLNFRLDFSMEKRFKSKRDYEIDDLYKHNTTGVDVVPRVRKEPWKIGKKCYSTEKVKKHTGLNLKEINLSRKALLEGAGSLGESTPDGVWRCGESGNYLIAFDTPTSMSLIRDSSWNSRIQVEIDFASIRHIVDGDIVTEHNVRSWGQLIQVNENHAGIRQPSAYKPLQTVLRLKELNDLDWEPLQNPAKVYWFKPQKEIRIRDGTLI